jgi:hypothetical protein
MVSSLSQGKNRYKTVAAGFGVTGSMITEAVGELFVDPVPGCLDLWYVPFLGVSPRTGSSRFPHLDILPGCVSPGTQKTLNPGSLPGINV